MDTHTPRFKVRLGLFVAGGLALFMVAIFLIGERQNLFSPIFTLTTIFHNVSGLQVGSNIRFSGISVGTVDTITIIDDSTVRVDMLIRKDVQKFIRADCEAAIGSSGIIGDRVLSITQGSADAPVVKDGQQVASKEPIETDAIIAKLKVTVDHAEVVAQQVEEISTKINTGNGTLARLINDSTMSRNFNQTVINLRKSSKGLTENMEAAKDSFLLRGSFKRKDKADQKAKEEVIERKADERKALQERKAAVKKAKADAKEEKRKNTATR